MEPLVIDVRCKENRLRQAREAVPSSTAEIAQTAVEVCVGGATIFHFHARDAHTGSVLHEFDAYRETMRLVEASTDLIVHPTTGFTEATAPEDRVRPIVELGKTAASKCDMAALAFGVTNLDRWNADCARFVPGNRVYSNTRDVIEKTLAALVRESLPMISVAWELSHIRNARFYRDAGLHPHHRLWQFALTAGDLVASPSPKIESLLAMRSEIPHGEPWMVWYQGGGVLRLAAHAIAMGAHVGIGLGHFGYDRLSHPTNARLVEKVVEFADIVGRPVAATAQTREILGTQ